MPNTKYPAEIRATGGGPSLQGRHARFRLSVRPTWHEDGQGRLSCAGLEQSLSFELILPHDLSDPASVRGAWEQIIRQSAAVRLPSLRFQGYVITSEWKEDANQDGAFAAAVVSFTLVGKEK